MKILKLSLIFPILTAVFMIIFPLNKPLAITGNFSINMGLLEYGFKSTRNKTSKSIDKITIPEIKSSINLFSSKGYQFNIGYSYDYILQSITYGGITLLRKNFKIETGLSLGFYNELPIKLIPGSYGTIEITPLKTIKISVFGYSSIFFKRLFSLKSVTTDFDQNILNLAFIYHSDYVNIGIIYNSKNLYKLASSSFIDNSLQDYQFEIKTDLKNSIINSDTILGGSNSIFKTSSINNRLIQIYVDETVYIAIKSINLSLGTRINILSFTLKDIKFISPPKLPYFNFHAGVNYKFGK